MKYAVCGEKEIYSMAEDTLVERDERQSRMARLLRARSLPMRQPPCLPTRSQNLSFLLCLSCYCSLLHFSSNVRICCHASSRGPLWARLWLACCARRLKKTCRPSSQRHSPPLKTRISSPPRENQTHSGPACNTLQSKKALVLVMMAQTWFRQRN